jgi:hypothetical protein
MKIRDLINENVDVSFWKKLDAIWNPEALEQITKQEKRQSILKSSVDKNTTPVLDKPLRKQEGFQAAPKKGIPTSAGYRGNVNTRVKAGHISKETGEKLSRNN